MTHAKDDSAISMVLEQIIENGFDGLDTAVSILINEAMRIERSRVLDAEPWQRTQSRKGYANGYKPKSVDSRIGKLALQIPQVRGPVQFYPNALEAATFTCSETPVLMFPRSPCAVPLHGTSPTSYRHLTGMKPNGCWIWQLKNTAPKRRGCPHGWRKTSPRALPCSCCPMRCADGLGQPT